MEKYSGYSIEEFVKDSRFIRWVLDGDKESDLFWEEFQINYPSQRQNLESAKKLVQALQAIEPDIPSESIEKIRLKIFPTKKRFHIFLRLGWAAIFIIFLGATGLVYQLMNKDQIDLAAIEMPVNKAEIIFADGTKKSIESDNSKIIQEKAGTIIVDSDTITTAQNHTKDHDTRLITIVMPYGKQSRLELSDGSIVQINAGSKISYPASFVGKTRDVYLCGEAYFDVKTNKQNPFIVHTTDMDVWVTGTTFNLSAYSDDTFSQAVLVEGVVEVNRKDLFKRNIKLQSGESLSMDKTSGEISKEFVNTDQYTSWVQGYYSCTKEPVPMVLKKLERYYNCKITCKENISGITFSGKLELKEDIERVIETLLFASPIEIELINNPK